MINNLFVPKQILKALRVSSANKVARILDDTSDSETSEYGQKGRRWGETSITTLNKRLKKTKFSSNAFQEYEKDSASEMAHDISSSESSSSESNSETAEQSTADVRQPRKALGPPSEEEDSSGDSRRSDSPNVSRILPRLSNNGGTGIVDSPAPGGFQNSTQLERRVKKLGQTSIKDFGELVAQTRRSEVEDERPPPENDNGTRLGCEEEFWFEPITSYPMIQAENTPSSHEADILVEDSPEDVEMYVVQCPLDLNPKHLEKIPLKDITGDGSTWNKLKLPNSSTSYEAVANRSESTSKVMCHVKLGVYKAFGEIIIVEDMNTEPQSSEETNSKSTRLENHKKTKRKKSDELPNCVAPLTTVSPKKRKRVDSDRLTTDLNESYVDEIKPRKKKKKKNKYLENGTDDEHNFTTPPVVVPEPVEEPTPVKKKKKKKKNHDDVEIVDQVVESEIKEELPEENADQDVSKKAKKKKKRRKEADLEA